MFEWRVFLSSSKLDFMLITRHFFFFYRKSQRGRHVPLDRIGRYGQQRRALWLGRRNSSKFVALLSTKLELTLVWIIALFLTLSCSVLCNIFLFHNMLYCQKFFVPRKYWNSMFHNHRSLQVAYTDWISSFFRQVTPYCHKDFFIHAKATPASFDSYHNFSLALSNIFTVWPRYFFSICSLSILTGGNWQKWKRVFLTCPCHETYRDESVGLKSCKNTWKITIFVKMWNLGQYRENLIFCQ